MSDLAVDVTFPNSFLESVNDPDDADTGNQDGADDVDSLDGEQPTSSTSDDGAGSVDDLLARAEQGDVEAMQELRKGYLRHGDYTKKTQEVAQVRQQLEQFADEHQFLRGFYKTHQNGGTKTPDTGATASQTDDEVEALLSQLPTDDDDPNASGMRKFLSEYATAVEKRALKKAEAANAPYKERVARESLAQQFDQHKQYLVQKYGQGIEEHWDKIAAATWKELQTGKTTSPEQVLIAQAPDLALQLLQSAKKNQNKARTRNEIDRSMEGSEIVRYRRPVEADADIPTSKRPADMSTGARTERVMKRLSSGRKFADFKAALANR